MTIILTKEILIAIDKFRVSGQKSNPLAPQVHENKCMNCGKTFMHDLENVPMCLDCTTEMIIKCRDCTYVQEDMDCHGQCLDELSEKVC